MPVRSVCCPVPCALGNPSSPFHLMAAGFPIRLPIRRPSLDTHSAPVWCDKQLSLTEDLKSEETYEGFASGPPLSQMQFYETSHTLPFESSLYSLAMTALNIICPFGTLKASFGVCKMGTIKSAS